jgi:hypothetical protein
MLDKLKAIFLAALDTPADQRPAYLERACGADPEVRRRVEALLRAHQAPDPLLDRSPWGLGSVGGAIVLRGRESRPQGEGHQVRNVPQGD